MIIYRATPRSLGYFWNKNKCKCIHCLFGDSLQRSRLSISNKLSTFGGLKRRLSQWPYFWVRMPSDGSSLTASTTHTLQRGGHESAETSSKEAGENRASCSGRLSDRTVEETLHWGPASEPLDPGHASWTPLPSPRPPFPGARALHPEVCAHEISFLNSSNRPSQPPPPPRKGQQMVLQWVLLSSPHHTARHPRSRHLCALHFPHPKYLLPSRC